MPVTARRIREWPRVVAAAVVLAAVLVVIGVVVASASAGGGSGGGGANGVTAALRQRAAHQATVLEHDAQTLAGLRSQLAAASAEISADRSALTKSRARAWCWRQLALYPHATPVANCASAS